MKPNLIVLASALVLAALAGSCALPAAEETAAPDSRAVIAPFQVTVATDAPSYRVGQTVKMTITAKNVSSSPATLTFNTSQFYDFVVTFYRSPVYRWSTGKGFLQVICSAVIQPGQSVSFSVAEWKAVGPAGTYDLLGTLTSNPPYTARTQFRIVR